MKHIFDRAEASGALRPGMTVDVHLCCPPTSSLSKLALLYLSSKKDTIWLLNGFRQVVAASSGNTGAATAMLCAMRGYKCIITTNKKCSREKADSIKVLIFGLPQKLSTITMLRFLLSRLFVRVCVLRTGFTSTILQAYGAELVVGPEGVAADRWRSSRSSQHARLDV